MKYNCDANIIKDYFKEASFSVPLDFDEIIGEESAVCVCRNGVWEKVSLQELTAIQDEADALILQDVLCYSFEPAKIFNLCNIALKKGGLLALSETTPSIEDAYLNTLEFKLNKDHARFYTAKEIITHSDTFFTPVYFKATLVEIKCNSDKLSAYIEEAKTFPNYVAEKMCMMLCARGTFILQKLPLCGSF